MHLDERDVDRRERVANREARVAVRAGVDHDAAIRAAQTMNCVDQLAFTVVLREFNNRSELRGTDRKDRSMSASVSCPYIAGSRVPRRFRLGPLRTAILTFFS